MNNIISKKELISFIENEIKNLKARVTRHPLSNANFDYNRIDPEENSIVIAERILTTTEGSEELAEIFGNSNTTGDSIGVSTICWKADRVWMEYPEKIDDGEFYKVELFADPEKTFFIDKNIDKIKVRRRVIDFINKSAFDTIIDIAIRYNVNID